MTRKEKDFIQTVWDFYKHNGRHELPWRKTKNPYHILVSEVMLQQTQVDRVIPKYKSFLKVFPTFQKLAQASLGDVLLQWQGLGYNRRAKMLHQCAQQVVEEYRGKLPADYEKLTQLSGIGPYTAGAVMAFSYNKPLGIIETNIRTVFIHHFFHEKTAVTDAEIYKFNERCLDRDNPRQWYWALMDYGSYLKKVHKVSNNKSKHYTKQSRFQGSDRQIRGAIIRILSENIRSSYTRRRLFKELTIFEEERIDMQLKKLQAEGMLYKTKQLYHLPF